MYAHWSSNTDRFNTDQFNTNQFNDTHTLPVVPEGYQFTVEARPSGVSIQESRDLAGMPSVPGQYYFEPIPQVPEEMYFREITGESQENGENSFSEVLSDPWWYTELLRQSPEAGLRVELEELIWLAVAHSPAVQSMLIEPQILSARAEQKLGDFDITNYVDSIFRDTSEPVGNTLVTGGPDRLNEHLWENRSGFRGRNQSGGQTEFFQEFLFRDSNSLFFVPTNQSDTRMVLRYTQPLMRGRGSDYNRASYVVASIAANQSRFSASATLQEHAYRISEAYWEIYVSQAIIVQIQRGLESLQSLHDQLQGRSELDSLKSQILRAQAAIYRQSAELASAEARRKSAEANLKAAVGSPELLKSPARLIPTSRVVLSVPDSDAEQERLKALQFQPRIQEATEGVKSARKQLQVAEHELKPTLNMVMEGYLRGLNGDFNAARSFGDQFSTTPSYHVGLAYQRPRANTAARAILQERRMELRKALLKLDEALLSVSAEVEGAVARVLAAYQQMDAAVRSTAATEAEVQYLSALWNDAFLSGSKQSSLQLDQLLNAHIQLIISQNNWVQSEKEYMLALARLQLATGSLLPSWMASPE